MWNSMFFCLCDRETVFIYRMGHEVGNVCIDVPTYCATYRILILSTVPFPYIIDVYGKILFIMLIAFVWLSLITFKSYGSSMLSWS